MPGSRRRHGRRGETGGEVQLSRSVLAGQTDRRTACLSAEDSSNTHCSSRSRLCRGDDHHDDVIRLPDSVVVDHPGSDIIDRLTNRRRQKHEDAMKQMEAELRRLGQVCEDQVRTVSEELKSSLQAVDLMLDTLKDKMDLDHLSPQEECVLWEEVQQEVQQRRSRILELDQRLRACEAQRSEEIRVVLRKSHFLLENISFLSPPDLSRLMDHQAMMLNQSLLANRHSVARLLLLLQEENLQQEVLLHQSFEEAQSRWRRSRVQQVVDQFRALCTEDHQLTPDQLTPDQLTPDQLTPDQLTPDQLMAMTQTQRQLTDRRCDIINDISSLVPPTCSSTLVSDWFNRLTAVNQLTEGFHSNLVHQLRSSYEEQWAERLQRCQEALSALQLPQEEVNNILHSQLLPLIGRRQHQEEERLAALDVSCDSAARGAVSVSACVFAVMRAVALLWETHSRRIERREEEVDEHLEELRHSEQRHTERKHLDELLGQLRQESSEELLQTSLKKTTSFLQEVQLSCRRCVSEQCQVLDRLPSLLLDEMFSYSSSIASFLRLSYAYTPGEEELQSLLPSSWSSSGGAPQLDTGTSRATEKVQPISCQETDPAPPSQDWLTEAESSLLDLCDISNYVTFTSWRGVAYSGPAFRSPAPDLPQEPQLSVFPVDLLTLTLSRSRSLLMDHLEQRFHDVLTTAVSMVTERKEALRAEQEVQLQQLDPKHIHTELYLPRLAELQLHRQRVDSHCEEVSSMLTSCREELQEVQTSISRSNQEFSSSLSVMEEEVQQVDSSRRLEAVSSALQVSLDQHLKHTQHLLTCFRLKVEETLEEVRHRTAQLLSSFRLFSEGGDFAPQEVEVFQRRLKKETNLISVTEEKIYWEMKMFESKSLQQVKEASAPLEEKLLLLRSEVEFMEKIQKLISSTQVHLKAEACSSNQQQSSISSKLEELRKMMENTQVSPDELLSHLSSVSEDLRRRCQYLDLQSPSAGPQSRQQVQSAPPAGPLQPSSPGVDLFEDPVVGIIRSLNRFSLGQQDTEESTRTRASTGQSLEQRQHRVTESVSTLSVFQVFGPKPEQSPHSLSSAVTSVLWTANNEMLLVAKEFYDGRRSRPLLLPGSLSQWAGSTQQRLLGYQDQTRKLLGTSREEVERQLSVWAELLRAVPVCLIGNYERQKRAELSEEVGGVRQRLEEQVVSIREQRVPVCLSMSVEQLQEADTTEEERQQQLDGAICSSHLELQECVRVRGEEFVTSLASLTEELLPHLDLLLSPAEAMMSQQHTEDSAVTMETGAGQKPSSVTMTTASHTNTRCIMGHQAVTELRDTAVKSFQQLLQCELSRSDEDKRRRLSELHNWNTHWRQQIHTLTHMIKH